MDRIFARVTCSYSRHARFFETSAAAILTMLLLHYKIELVEEPQYAHETPEERRERVLAASPGITITSVHIGNPFDR